jgi:hypothetical protein
MVICLLFMDLARRCKFTPRHDPIEKEQEAWGSKHNEPTTYGTSQESAVNYIKCQKTGQRDAGPGAFFPPCNDHSRNDSDGEESQPYPFPRRDLCRVEIFSDEKQKYQSDA